MNGSDEIYTKFSFLRLGGKRLLWTHRIFRKQAEGIDWIQLAQDRAW
jgi:hypothetical protein